MVAVSTEIEAGQVLAMLSAAVDYATEQSIRIIVAVVDRAGLTCGTVRMLDSDIGAASIAIDKAWTSASFGGASTGAMSDALSGYPPHAIALLASRPRYLPLAGGLPVRFGGKLAGAVGVAGASPDQDESVARAALAAIGADAA